MKFLLMTILAAFIAYQSHATTGCLVKMSTPEFKNWATGGGLKVDEATRTPTSFTLDTKTTGDIPKYFYFKNLVLAEGETNMWSAIDTSKDFGVNIVKQTTDGGYLFVANIYDMKNTKSPIVSLACRYILARF